MPIIGKGRKSLHYAKGVSSTQIGYGNLAADLVDEDVSSVSGSHDTLASALALKTYLDAQVTAQDVDITTDSGTIAIDLDSETLTISGGEGIDTSATGNTLTIAGEDATTSNKGIASFSSDNFGVSSGVVTIKSQGVALAEIINIGANTVLVRDANSSGTVSAKTIADTELLIGDGTGFTAATLSGDVTMANTGAVTIASNAVEGSMLNSNVADDSSIELSSNTLNVKATGITNAMLAGSIANSKLANASITVSDGSNTSPIALGSTVTFSGTSNEVTVAENNGTVTIGLPDDVTIAGDLTINGDTTTVNTATLSVEDPLIIMASGNNAADSVDIGFYGLYDTSGSQDLYAGLFRDASDSGKWKLFKDTQAAPTTTVNTGGTGYAVGTLVANLEGNVVGNVTGNTSGSSGSTTGNAATATALATARTIGGTSFDGTANIAVALSATTTALASARTIGGVSFDGTANINLPGVNASGNQDTSGNATTATTATNSTNVAVTDNENTNENDLIPFVANAGTSTGNHGLEMDGDFHYNPSTGRLTATEASVTTLVIGGTNVTSTAAEINLLDALDRGSILYGNSSGATAVLGQGGANQVLTSDGTDIAWQAIPTPTDMTISANNSTDETVYPVFVDGATGSQGLESDTGLTYNPNSGVLTATQFTGALSGNASTATALANARTIGGTSFDGSANIAVALAATATALATARTIGGVSFDGTANINLPGVNAAGNQDTSGTATLATNITATANNSTDETVYPVFVDGVSGSQGIETDSGFTYNPSSGLLTISGELDAGSLDVSGDADIDGTLEADAITVDGTALNEYIADTVGAMVTSNTESGITVAYQDADNTLDFTVGTLNQDTTGNAATATALETARNIGGVSFNGTANINLPGVNASGTQDTSGNASTATALENARTIGGTSFDGTANIAVALSTEATNVTAVANNSTDETVYPTFVDGATGTQGIETDTGLTYNPSSGVLTSTQFTGAVSGNATTATALASGRTIGMTGDVVWTSASFDGSGNVTGSAVIQATSVENSMLAGSIADSKLNTITTADKVSGAAVQVDGATDGTGITIVDADKFLVDDAGTTKYVNASQIKSYMGDPASEGFAIAMSVAL